MVSLRHECAIPSSTVDAHVLFNFVLISSVNQTEPEYMVAPFSKRNGDRHFERRISDLQKQLHGSSIALEDRRRGGHYSHPGSSSSFLLLRRFRFHNSQ
mmetsp:Transcript_28962/g.60565  ORF Transcript_28962/g.60565 Transcript_28962/m.60565 type:complete len:99 (-) Transcript_28962:2592-2888(-)